MIDNDPRVLVTFTCNDGEAEELHFEDQIVPAIPRVGDWVTLEVEYSDKDGPKFFTGTVESVEWMYLGGGLCSVEVFMQRKQAEPGDAPNPVVPV